MFNHIALLAMRRKPKPRHYVVVGEQQMCFTQTGAIQRVLDAQAREIRYLKTRLKALVVPDLPVAPSEKLRIRVKAGSERKAT
jgi:hypothetical protein